MTQLFTLMRRTVAAAAGAGMVLLLTAPAALAHDRLKSSSPADKAKVERVETIELEFTAPMTMPAIVLEGPGGKPVPVSKPRAQDIKVTADPEEELAAGRYRLAWRVVSSDGHPIQGELTFTVTAPPASETPTPSTSTTQASPALPASAPPPASPAAAPAAAEGGGVPGWLWIAAAVLVLGGVGF
ncbi:copper resistance CopC family protein, partial [Nonomuraea wenchangensis]